MPEERQTRRSVGSPLGPKRDPEQEQVADAPVNLRQLVLAGPGTGKTETVAKRLVHLLKEGIRPSQILVLSFSRSAVQTLTRRIEQFATTNVEELEELRHLSIRTFDSWTFRMLRQLNFQPASLLRKSYNENISTLVSAIRNEHKNRVSELLHSVRHVIVDEFQDLGGVRGALVLELFALLAPRGMDHVGFTVLGDEAQAIYGFALREEQGEFVALSPRALLNNMRRIYAGELMCVELKTNYRATEKLASVATALRNILTSPISGEKKLEAMQKLVARIPKIEDELESVPFEVDGKSSAVLTRTNGEVLRVAQKLAGYEVSPVKIPILHGASRSANVPAWVGATLGRAKSETITRSQFARIYSHLYGKERVAQASAVGVPAEDAAWARLARAVGAGVDTSSIQLVILRERLGWLDLLPDDDGVNNKGIHVMTIHQSKGMEFSCVAIMEPDPDAQVAESKEKDAEEEANVIFVGVSRAGETLWRIPVGSTYAPLRLWTFTNSQRARWGAWRKGWMNIEVGIYGDVSQTSFVDTTVHGSASAVRAAQESLASNAISLRGHKVMLCKRALPGKEHRFVYDIHLQNDNMPGLLLGSTTPQLTYDLLSKLHGANHHYPLPKRIFNVRIQDVVTMTFEGEPSQTIGEDWIRSGLWLGVTLFGTGDFKTFTGR